MGALPSFKTGMPNVQQGYVRPLDGVELPFTIIEGAMPGPCLVVTAGVHASEFCSIEAAVRLQKTRPQEIKGTLVVLPIMNVQGFWKRSIYVMPQDGKNLNRQFPGDANGTISQKLAHWLTNAVLSKADFYLDLHGGDLDESLMPFTIYPRHSKESQELATAFGLPIAIASSGTTSSINGGTGVDVPSLLPEVSGNGLWNDELVGSLTAGIERVMKHIGMIDRPVQPAPVQTPQFVTMWVPTAPVRGLWYCAREVGDYVAEGETLGEIRSVFGESLATIPSQRAGRIVYRLTSLSVNEGEALLGVAAPLETSEH
jgi:predicted deacylase